MSRAESPSGFSDETARADARVAGRRVPMIAAVSRLGDQDAPRTCRRLLLVEDDPMVAELLKDALSVQGFSVSVVEDAVQAVCVAKRLSPDLIVMDFVLPGGDGANILGTLRWIENTRRIPVLFLTAAPLDTVWARLGTAPGVRVLAKAVGLAAFLREVTRMLPRPAGRIDSGSTAGARSGEAL